MILKQTWKTSIIVSRDVWERSTSIPKRFISLTTVCNRNHTTDTYCHFLSDHPSSWQDNTWVQSQTWWSGLLPGMTTIKDFLYTHMHSKSMMSDGGGDGRRPTKNTFSSSTSPHSVLSKIQQPILYQYVSMFSFGSVTLINNPVN